TGTPVRASRSVSVSGPSGAQLAENLTASAVTWDDEAEKALAGLAEDAETYWARRAALPWA
ncbi:hypothetical protein AB0B00_39290, partial [Microbispora hainanensis]